MKTWSISSEELSEACRDADSVKDSIFSHNRLYLMSKGKYTTDDNVLTECYLGDRNEMLGLKGIVKGYGIIKTADLCRYLSIDHIYDLRIFSLVVLRRIQKKLHFLDGCYHHSINAIQSRLDGEIDDLEIGRIAAKMAYHAERRSDGDPYGFHEAMRNLLIASMSYSEAFLIRFGEIPWLASHVYDHEDESNYTGNGLDNSFTNWMDRLFIAMCEGRAKWQS